MAKVARLKIIKPTNVDWSVFGELMRDLDYIGWKIKNRTITRYHDLVTKELEYNNENEKRMNGEKRKEVYGYASYENVIINEIKEDYSEYGLYSEILPGLVKEAVQAYKKVQKDMMRGSATIPTFKRGQPVPVRSRQIKILDKDKLSISLVNKKGGESRGVPKKGNSYSFEVAIASKKNYAKEIMNHFISGRYELCDSRIQKDGKDVYLQLVYKDTEVKHYAVDKDTILGIDLGISKAVTMVVSDSPKYDFIEGGEIEAFRKRTEARRRSIQNQLKYASENRKGHGRKTLLKPLEVLSNKIENFKDLTNHRYSKYIVDYAIKNGCGIIQFEDLTGINNTSSFLANWSYYDLQTKVKYKAQDAGIEVVMISPKYTSQRCNKCGIIDKENRKSQEMFECINCGHKANADVNAARNIATKDIENIILDQLESQKSIQQKLALFN